MEKKALKTGAVADPRVNSKGEAKNNLYKGPGRKINKRPVKKKDEKNVVKSQSDFPKKRSPKRRSRKRQREISGKKISLGRNKNQTLQRHFQKKSTKQVSIGPRVIEGRGWSSSIRKKKRATYWGRRDADSGYLELVLALRSWKPKKRASAKCTNNSR